MSVAARLPSDSEWANPNKRIWVSLKMKNYSAQLADFSSLLRNGISQVEPVVIEEHFNLSNINVLPYTMGEYKTIKPFQVSIESIAKNEFIGTFEEAGISFSGKTIEDTVDAVKIEVIEVYELYKSEAHLGAWPKKQLSVLEKYIAKK